MNREEHDKRLSNAEIEMLWVDAWNELADLLLSINEPKRILVDGSEVSIDEGQEWLQNAAYCVINSKNRGF